ncbi:MAG: hypothetical protein UT58_C0017G0003 [Microgenomates group bacterium GW2011_GWC1_39_7b]|uniref:Uncharacterized protein n=3 Tax=Candidatus Woeseibacteriota TaxID=1752722 RepID=A0A0G0X7A1_9BACT|nr:MAG: hypothetical protein UT17_C0002G0114 [Candidatus Woesebacteria bacterium GW2011_GWB1_39_10]KKR26249.1 MAG: hypothetical protein UT58_C0017G0003 [Microgenomates group bacterium GW2011_GWC1_39_7b]KKR74049.1 MAG: hypothetical protein UU16_C0006G0003 [Candidatus Woesebacteria bacterium GW2011_GWA2_40_7]KKR92535.1 MAG: hypothetical protein UU42_C0001G0139 [Candidatus Woesebacteria bacterium GW2011_GWA1_41_13b]
MLVNLVIIFIGVITFLFIFWKRLKEDYSSEIIFKAAFLILAVLTLFSMLGSKFLSGWLFFIETTSILIGVLIATMRLKVRFFETLEAAVVGLMPWLSLFFLADSVSASSLSSFFGFLAVLILIFVFYYLDVHYKNFGWYTSGKIGFSGITTIALIFLLRSLVAIMGISVLSFVSQSYEAIISGSIAFICFLVLYNLGRQ